MSVYSFTASGGISLGASGTGGLWVLRCRRRGVRALEAAFLGMYAKGRDEKEKWKVAHRLQLLLPNPTREHKCLQAGSGHPEKYQPWEKIEELEGLRKSPYEEPWKP